MYTSIIFFCRVFRGILSLLYMMTTARTLPLRIAFYIRVSTEDQKNGYGMDLQESALRALLQSKGKLTDGEGDAYIFAGDPYIYKDDISGTTSLEERPAFRRLMEDISRASEGNRPFDVLATFKIDRLARKLKILLEAVDFLNTYGIGLISAHESMDTSTPFGRAMLGIVGVLAELEVETIKLRTHAGKQEAIDKGIFMGSVPPYGYIKDETKKLVIHKEEAKIVKQIFSLFAHEGKSIQAIATYLYQNNIESPDASAVKNRKRKGIVKKTVNKPQHWPHTMVRDILTDEIYIGKYYHNKTKGKKSLEKSKWELSKYNHPSIIDTALFLLVRDKLLKNTSLAKSNPKRNHIYLLTGLLKCSSCFDYNRDQVMHSWHGTSKEITKGSKRYTYSYSCGRKNKTKTSVLCNTIPIPAEQIEKYVISRILELIKDPEVVYAYQQNLESQLKEKALLNSKLEYEKRLLNSIPQMQENLREQHTIGVIDTDKLKDELKTLDTNKKDHQRVIQELELQIGEKALAEGYRYSLSLFNEKYEKVLQNLENNREQIQEIISLIVDKIVVHSRDVVEEDIIAGIKKENQKIPYIIDIYYKLPQKLLQSLLKQNPSAREIDPTKPFDLDRFLKFSENREKLGFGDKNSNW